MPPEMPAIAERIGHAKTRVDLIDGQQDNRAFIDIRGAPKVPGLQVAYKLSQGGNRAKIITLNCACAIKRIDHQDLQIAVAAR
jgi:hypothetical protein